MKVLRALRWIFFGGRHSLFITPVVLVILIVAIDYIRPRTMDVVYLNTVVKRSDVTAPDAYRVNYTRLADDGQIDPDAADVFRNEDAFLPYPPFFKWNSGRLDSKLNALPKHTIIQVRAYGWRIPLFTMFKNLIDFEVIQQPKVQQQ